MYERVGRPNACLCGDEASRANAISTAIKDCSCLACAKRARRTSSGLPGMVAD